MSEEKIMLHCESDERGNVKIVDQHGRELGGIKSFTLESDLTEAPETLTVRVLLFNESGLPYFMGRR